MNRWPSTFLLAVAVAWSAVSRGGDICVETTGTADVSRVTTHGVPIPSECYTAPFSVTLSDDGRFKIDLFNQPFYPKRQITFSFDGTNYYYLISRDTNVTASTALCYLSAEEMPLIIFEDPARDALWYSICSGNFFKKHGQSGEILQLFDSPRRSVIGYGYRYKAAFTNSIFCLPYGLDVWRDKAFDKKDRAAEESRPELDVVGRGSRLYDSQWAGKMAIPDGNHLLELVWKKDFLLHDQRLPLEVGVTVFYPASSNPPPVLSIGLRFEPWHLSTLDGRMFCPPPPTQPTRVRDARIRMQKKRHYLDEVVYRLGVSPTNSSWLPTNNRWLQQGHRVILNAQIKPDANTRKWAIVLVMFAVVSPVLFYFFPRRGGRNFGQNK